MTELFETGSRILAHGRRLFAAPPLAELPAVYATLLRDPCELLEELLGGVEHVETAREFESPRLARKGVGATAAETLSGESKWLLNSPVNVAQTPAAVTKAVPLRLSESRPRAATTSSTKDESSVPSTSRQGTASSHAPLEFAPVSESHAEESDSYMPKPVSSDKPAKVVEWPTTSPATAAVGSAEIATPGNVLQEMEVEAGGDPELRRLRSQLEVEEGNRQPRQTQPLSAEAELSDASRADVYPSDVPYAHVNRPNAAAPTTPPPTSFSSLSQLLKKNLSRPETAADFAPREPEIVNAGDTPFASVSALEPAHADAEREDARGEGRRETTPLVDEVLEELYERLRLEFSRTYGTTGG
jgi:hypothetical protein